MEPELLVVDRNELLVLFYKHEESEHVDKMEFIDKPEQDVD